MPDHDRITIAAVWRGYKRLPELREVLREGQLHASGSHQITWQGLADEQTRAKDSARESGKYWDGTRGASDTTQDNVDGPTVCPPTYMAENVNVGKVDGLMLSTTRDGLLTHRMFCRRQI